jgi:hypothetical protein
MSLPRDEHEGSRVIVEPITLAAVGTVALTEGIRFLYTQAGEVLKRWREKHDAAESGVVPPDSTAPIDVELPEEFEGQLSEPRIHFDILDQLEGDLRDTRRSLSGYAEDIEKVDNNDEDLLVRVDVLRRLLEAILQERITFKGENRSPSGPVVEGRIDVDQVAGYAAAVRARRITGGHVGAEAKSRRVESGGEFIGVDVDEIGKDK